MQIFINKNTKKIHFGKLISKKKQPPKETAFDCGSEEAGDFVVGDAALTGDYLREARNRCFRPKSCISRPISSSLARKRMLSSRPKAKRIRR